MDYKNTKIVVHDKDTTGDQKYCAIVMGLTETGWVNTGLVVREFLPLMAFSNAMELAIKKGIWK